MSECVCVCAMCTGVRLPLVVSIYCLKVLFCLYGKEQKLFNVYNKDRHFNHLT
jgi:hypothetical protein